MNQQLNASDPKPPDGRHKRSEQSRQKIAAAMIDLIMEGVPSPSAEEIAERAKVGLRSVFRHFKDMDSLFVEVSSLFRAEHVKDFDLPESEGPWQKKLEVLSERRLDLYDRIFPMMQATARQKERSPFVHQDHMAFQARLRRQLLAILPDALQKDPARLEALDAILSPDMWLRLRVTQSLPSADARAVVKRAVQVIGKED